MAVGGRRRGQQEGLNAWPGYVDALATLLIIIIFVLLVFVLAQGFLTVTLSSRDRALDRLNRQVAELAEMLSLERGQTEELRAGLGRAQDEARAAAAARDSALRDLLGLRDEAARAGSERDALRTERDRLAARLSDADLAGRGNAERIASLEARLAEALSGAEAAGTDVARTVRGLTETRRALATEQAARQGAERTLAETRSALEGARSELAGLRQEIAQLDRQTVTDRATIEARVSELANLSQQLRALTALRDQMERQAQAAMARAGEEERRRRAAESEASQAEAAAAAATRQREAAEARAAEAVEARTAAETALAEGNQARGTAEARAGEYGRLAESARAQAALLAQQLDSLRAELRRVAAALEAQEATDREKDTQIASLGQRLNTALAARVEELQRYRSDFFGRLREVLGDRPEVRIAGDRFVFQSEVLFPVGSAELSESGREQIANVTGLLMDIARRIPPEVNWVLRVDGHADNSPIRQGGRFSSNWELSAARAIAVAQLMIQNGLPANRVAAAAFGEFQPVDEADTPQARARNRRIELRLTDR
jgi:chemotaxis protein MotB